MSKSMEAVGTGKLLSKESLAAQVNPNLVGFGKADPHCPACHHMSEALNYGLGVVIRCLPLVKHSLSRTVANKSDHERTETTVVRSTCRQRLPDFACSAHADSLGQRA